MRINKHILVAFLLGCSLIWGCRDIYEQEKYQRPEWLAGKIYTQVNTREDLSVFSTCLQLTGYDTILDVTGSYTVFAPTDQAFGEWFSLHPEYGNSPENIPPQILENLVERHILQNGWSLKQLRSLDIYGWIDEDDPDNDKPRGYKRQTIQKDPDRKYYVLTGRQFDQIVDSTESDDYRKVYARSRKYGPVYFNDYFAVNDLSTDDYSFYYDRSFESSATFYANSKIVSPEIFAENGFIYEVDKVNDPLHNAEQILAQEFPQMSFTTFRDLIYLFAEFTVDMEATNLQPEAKQGGLFDTLYTLNYPSLLFNIQEELTGPNTSVTNYTVRYQNGLLAPTNDAFQKFLDEIVTSKSGYPHWVDLGAVPLEVKRVIVNSHMADIPIYRTDIQLGFRNGAQDMVTVDEGDIAYKYYGSNCSFIGLNEAIVPRAFSSITGPIYLRPGYSTLLYALEYSKTLPALKEEGQDYAFYVQSDRLMQEDSSLFVNWINREQNRYGFRAFDRGNESFTNISRNQLTKMVLNQVGLRTPRGYASKEFIENLAGNFIVVNNEDNTVSGGLPNYWGYNGDSVIDIHPLKLEELTDNGTTYDVGGWFNTPITDMYSRISTYPHFFDLMQEAGLFDDVYYTFPFLTEGELYTIFVPSEEAIAELDTDALSQEELQQIIKYHFIRGARIWTDGSSPEGYYETLRVDESSTEFTTKYSSLYLETFPDLIRILDDEGAVFTEIPEREGSSNVMIATDLDEDSDSRYDYIITSVIHEIDKILIKP